MSQQLQKPTQQTQMQAKPVEEKLVKIRTIRDIRLANGTQVKPDQEVEVTEEEAKLFCDTEFKLNYSGFGEGHYGHMTVSRAKRL